MIYTSHGVGAAGAAYAGDVVGVAPYGPAMSHRSGSAHEAGYGSDGCVEACAEGSCARSVAVPMGQWQFVGEGRGGYERITQYSYVGEGHGNYTQELVSRPVSYKMRPVCVLLLLSTLALVAWVISLPGPQTSTTLVQQMAALPGGEAGLDCEQAGGATPEQIIRCCADQNKLCPQIDQAPAPMAAASPRAAPSPPVAPMPFDCLAGLGNYQAGWSDAKKEWCCQNQGKGCEARAASAPAATHAAAAAAGECLVWGDPHIQTFDHSRADFLGQGEAWLVRSEQIYVQARYKATPWTNGLAATDAIAIGGPFLQGHILKIGAMETGQILWDDAPICTEFPSVFNAPGFGTVNYDDNGDLVDAAQGHLQRHIVHIALPMSLHVQVMRWSHHINVRIRMLPQPGQDGHCGNFNSRPQDDDNEQIRARVGLSVPRDKLLFKTYIHAQDGLHLTLADCKGRDRTDAEAKCRAARPGIAGVDLNTCVFDVCFVGQRYAAQDVVY